MKGFARCLLLVVLFCSCQSALDCVNNTAPKWQNKSLDEGARFQPYDETVSLEGGSSFSIQEFRVAGALPTGIDCVFDGVTARFSGTPTTLGEYEFKLKVRIGYYNYEETATTCSQDIERKYKIRID